LAEQAVGMSTSFFPWRIGLTEGISSAFKEEAKKLAFEKIDSYWLSVINGVIIFFLP